MSKVKFDQECIQTAEDILRGILLAIKERTINNVKKARRTTVTPDDVREAFEQIKSQWRQAQ